MNGMDDTSQAMEQSAARDRIAQLERRIGELESTITDLAAIIHGYQTRARPEHIGESELAAEGDGIGFVEDGEEI